MTEQVFQCYLTRALRRQGLHGSVAWVRVTPELIDFTGTESGQFRVRIDDIVRLRVGYVDAKSRTYETRLWTWGAGRPLRIVPVTSAWAAYGAATRLIASELLARQRGDRIEQGASKFDAVFGPLMMGLLVVAAIGISIFALENEPWWGRLFVPAIPVAIFGALLWVAVRRSWPRPIVSLSDLDVQLPPHRSRGG